VPGFRRGPGRCHHYDIRPGISSIGNIPHKVGLTKVGHLSADCTVGYLANRRAFVRRVCAIKGTPSQKIGPEFAIEFRVHVKVFHAAFLLLEGTGQKIAGRCRCFWFAIRARYWANDLQLFMAYSLEYKGFGYDREHSRSAEGFPCSCSIFHNGNDSICANVRSSRGRALNAADFSVVLLERDEVHAGFEYVEDLLCVHVCVSLFRWSQYRVGRIRMQW